MSEAPEATDPWADALLAADLIALDPAGLGGVRLRARPGPARDMWLARLRAGLPAGAPVRRIPAHAAEERLLGGLDLAATLSAGRPVGRLGLLAEADGGVAVLAMAERAAPVTAAHLARALDTGHIRVERDGLGAEAQARLAVVALDEGLEAEETAPPALRERLAFDLPLDGLRPAPACAPPDLAAARARLNATTVPEPLVEALCRASLALGVDSPRGVLFAVRAARALAACAGRAEAVEADAALAARLVLGPRATRFPAEPEPDDPPPEPPPPDPDEAPPSDADAMPDDMLEQLADMLVAAARATLPAGLLARLRSAEAARGRGPSGGSAGAMRKAHARGRPIGARPEGGKRLDLVETLRAAAPWQPLRRREAPGRTGLVLVRADDFRIRRFRRPAETVTIFVVDASGSSAAQRLGEAKGAVELLLAESYTRRDRVALVAFRGTGAQVVLPPTRSLARAKRELAGLPGGGGTPLAAGLDAGLAEAEAARRHGWTPTLVLLTDGRANVRRDGQGGRAAALAEAEAAGARLTVLGFDSILIDTSPRPNPDAARLALAMGARYLPLPRADAATVTAAVRAGQRPD